MDYARIWSFLLILSVFKVCISRFQDLRYVPAGGNIAIGRPITATSICGISGGPQQYCSIPITTRTSEGSHSNTTTSASVCGICDGSVDALSHGPVNMVDSNGASTWWQSENDVENVTIDIDFEKLFFFTHVIVSFSHVRPALMTLEKSTDSGRSYQPLLNYASDCSMAAELPGSDGIPCTSLYSQLTPGEVLYLPTAEFPTPDFTNESHIDRFTVSNLRIRLSRQHPVLGNDPTSPGTVLRRFYAIDHIEVYGWCYCNGHTNNSCIPSDIERETDGMVPSVCQCSGGTIGTHCQECGPRNRNGPWNPGFSPSNETCQECQCNEHADTCHYNESLGYGVCEGCDHNTNGDSCDTCEEGFYRNSLLPITDTDTCIECQCNPAGVLSGHPLCVREDNSMYTAGTCLCKPNVTGSGCDQCETGFLAFNEDLEEPCQMCPCPDCDPYTGRCPCAPMDNYCCPFDQYLNVTCLSCDCDPVGSLGSCDLNGVCVCKPGVGGTHCDQCLHGYHNMTIDGCVTCGCDPSGSSNGSCDQSTGQCHCREDVGGVKCDTCPLGFMGPLPSDSAKACIECFCNGYSKQCESETGWFWTEAEDTFENEYLSGHWSSTGEIHYNSHEKSITVEVSSTETSRLVVELPSKYFGDKRTAYGMNMDISITAPLPEGTTAYLEIMGNLLKPARKLRGTLGLNNSKLAMVEQGLTIVRYNYDMRPANQDEVREVLATIKKIRLIVMFDQSVSVDSKYINITYAKLPYAIKDSTHLDMLRPLISAPVGESCSCPDSRDGSRCDHCSQHHTTDPSQGNEFDTCVRCVCFGSPNVCDSITGACIDCVAGTVGTHCELCGDEYYRDPVTHQCLPCNCPGGPGSVNQYGTSCVSDSMGSHVCRCPLGFAGTHCQVCDTGYIGDPSHPNGTCKMCSCNQNSGGGADTCDSVTGDCQCDSGYVGESCGLCDLGYYGNPLAHNCTECSCNLLGSVPNSFCDLGTGLCLCHENVTGRDCGECIPGHWGLSSGMGCQECGCSVLGSVHSNCDEVYGDCMCSEGYMGRACDECDSGYWRLPNGTCTACNCHLSTSVSDSCNVSTGICTCREGAMGDKCDQCVSMVTTGLLPLCELCDECSTRWHTPINELTLAVREGVVNGRRVNITLISHTEIDEGIVLVNTLYTLLEQIRELIQRSILTTLSQTVASLNVDLIGNIDIAMNLLDRISVVMNLLNDTNWIINEQLTRLASASTEMEYLRSLLGNLTQDVDQQYDVMEFNTLVTAIESSVIRSNNSYQLVLESINPAIVQITDSLNRFTSKRDTFILLRDNVSSLIVDIEERLSEYQRLFDEANRLLCGVLLYNQSVGGACNDGCGSVTCATCGGGDGCEGSFTQLTRASNISIHVLREVNTIRVSVLEELTLLARANTSSVMAAVSQQQLLEEVGVARTSIINLLHDIQNLTDLVNGLLSRRLPDLDEIGVLQNETLLYSISRTPEQVQEILLSINSTIDSFPLVMNVNNTELRRRAEMALYQSQQANITLGTILRTIVTVRDQIQYLNRERDRANDDIRRTRGNKRIIDDRLDQVKVLLDSSNSSIMSAMNRIQSLNNTLQSVREGFTNNSRQLVLVANTADAVEDKSLVLQQNTTRSMRVLEDINSTVQERLSSARETLFNVTMIRERLIMLRNSSHSQLLRARGLLNHKECIIARQSVIRDDIHRVGVELERLHNDIESHIARNTVCLRGRGTSKKK